MPVLDPDAFRARLAAVLGAEIDTVPSDLTGLWDMVGPALADYTRTKSTLSTDCNVFGVPTTDADGPRSLYQMTDAVVKRWRSAVDATADLAEVRTRLAAAGYVPAKGEALGDVVARAIADTREADEKREDAERETKALRDQFRDAKEHAIDLSGQLTSAAGMILNMSNTIVRLTY